jgi:hypothetical protein
LGDGLDLLLLLHASEEPVSMEVGGFLVAAEAVVSSARVGDATGCAFAAAAFSAASFSFMSFSAARWMFLSLASAA